MSTESNDKRRATRHGFWFGVVVGGLLVALVAGVAVSAATVSASLMLAAKAFGHGFGRAGLQDPEAARERAEFAASFILERVDATEEQQAEVKRIVSQTILDLVPLAEEHRANRDALHSEFSQVVIDGEESSGSDGPRWCLRSKRRASLPKRSLVSAKR